MKWTPEPWYAHGAFIVSDQGGTDERVNIYDTDPSNRERIVACVNACTGLNPAAIPALVEAAARWEKATQPLIITDEPKVATYNHSEFVAACRELRAALAAVKGTLTTPAASGEKGGGQ